MHGQAVQALKNGDDAGMIGFKARAILMPGAGWLRGLNDCNKFTDDGIHLYECLALASWESR
jgi:hypothetical protein